MHAISAFVRPEPDKAETMLAELAELLRLSLDGSDDQVVPLEREMEFLRRYLSIQKTRLGDRLALRVEVAGADGVRVPACVLQPLVENAVEHGIALRREGGRLDVEVRPDGDRVHITVANDGPEIDPAELGPGRWGVGLSNTHDRLHQLYGRDGLLELEPREGGGVVARLTLPLEPRAPEPA